MAVDVWQSSVTEEKDECQKSGEICGEQVILREQELEGEDEYHSITKRASPEPAHSIPS